MPVFAVRLYSRGVVGNAPCGVRCRSACIVAVCGGVAPCVGALPFRLYSVGWSGCRVACAFSIGIAVGVRVFRFFVLIVAMFGVAL